MDLCRICLNDLSEGISIYQNIGENQITLCIREIGKVSVEIDDGLPQRVCNFCLENLKIAWKLRKTIENSDTALRSEDWKLDIKVETKHVIPSIVAEPLRPESLKTANTGRRRVAVKAKCCMCGVDYSSEKELQMHCETSHLERLIDQKPSTTRTRFACQYCYRRFRQKKFLMEHFKDPNYTEPPVNRSRELEIKQKWKEKQTKVVCSICGLQLHDKRSLVLHESSKHSTLRHLKCDILGCKAAYGHEISLRKHKQKCHAEKKYTCNYCSRGFVYIRELKQHILSHLEKKPFQCDECSKSYSLKRILEGHKLAAHSGIEYPHRCDFCEKAYKWKEDLRAHRSAAHFGKFPYSCKNCGKGYCSSSNKNYHEKRCNILSEGQSPFVQELTTE